MKWFEDPVKIDAYLNEIEEQMCLDCKGMDEGYACYCDDCAQLADFRTTLKALRLQNQRLRLRRTDWQAKVREFHEALGQPVADVPGEIPAARKVLREDLIAEEADELIEAMGHDYLSPSDLPAVADALVDLLYVTIGTAVEYGIDLAPIFDAVHAANMRKVGGPVRGDGKVLKPDDWQPADVAALIRAQQGES